MGEAAKPQSRLEFLLVLWRRRVYGGSCKASLVLLRSRRRVYGESCKTSVSACPLLQIHSESKNVNTFRFVASICFSMETKLHNREVTKNNKLWQCRFSTCGPVDLDRENGRRWIHEASDLTMNGHWSLVNYATGTQKNAHVKLSLFLDVLLHSSNVWFQDDTPGSSKKRKRMIQKRHGMNPDHH